jgi:hypothetical protein
MTRATVESGDSAPAQPNRVLQRCIIEGPTGAAEQ